MTVTMSDKDTGSVAIVWVEDKEVRMQYAMGNNRERTRDPLYFSSRYILLCVD